MVRPLKPLRLTFNWPWPEAVKKTTDHTSSPIISRLGDAAVCWRLDVAYTCTIQCDLDFRGGWGLGIWQTS